MSRANHLWGAPHIHGELLKLGFTLAQSTVARYMYRGPPSQGWRTFLTNHAEGIAAIDLFVLPTITFRLLYCLVILRHGRRLWVSFGVTTNPTAEWISRQITEAFPWDSAPRYLIRDRETAYGPIFVQPTITFRLLYCLVILRHGRRLWVSFGVTTSPTAEWISRQIIEAFPWDSALAILFGTATLRMVRSSGSGCAPWASGTSRLHPDRRGRTRMSRG